MLLALLSDIHANLPAFEACLAAAASQGAERLVLLGDFVGYGPDPEAVVQRVIPLVEAGAIAIKGNHDAAALRQDTSMNPTAAQAMAWTREHLSPTARQFLSALPMEVSDGRQLFVHSDGSDPSAWHYVTDVQSAGASLDATRAHVTFCGHVHVPALYCKMGAGKITAHRPTTGVAIPLSSQRQWLAVCGSVGQPRDHNPAASFSIYDTATRTLTYHRAAYDVERVAQRIRDADLPESLAARLILGK